MTEPTDLFDVEALRIDPAAEVQPVIDLTNAIDGIIYEYTEGGGGSGVAADEIVRQLPELLYQIGWMPPATYERVQNWAMRTGDIPDHHVNRDVLTSHLCELADILHDR